MCLASVFHSDTITMDHQNKVVSILAGIFGLRYEYEVYKTFSSGEQ